MSEPTTIFWRRLQTCVRTYDKALVSLVSMIPPNIQPASSMLGKLTLPSIWIMILVAVCVALHVNSYPQLASMAIIVTASIPLGGLLKFCFRRPRPKTRYAQNMRVKSYSFPSSHAYAATIAGGYLALVSLAVFSSPVSYIVAVAYCALIVIVGISRIHVGAHYPTDVTAGWLLGVAVLYVVLHT